MRKFILYITFSLFVTQNVYADIQKTGQCVGYLSSKMKYEGGLNSLPEPNLKWIKENGMNFQIVSKILKEQKNCIIDNQPYLHCLSSYSNYERELFTWFNTGVDQYSQVRYIEAKKALWDLACSEF